MYGISFAQLAEVAPYHLALDPDLRVVQEGQALYADLAATGQRFGERFTLVCPDLPLTFSALAQAGEMRHFLDRYGPDKLLFGSDFPFGTPGQELRKIERLNLSAADFDQVAGGNILRLLDGVVGPGNSRQRRGGAGQQCALEEP